MSKTNIECTKDRGCHRWKRDIMGESDVVSDDNNNVVAFMRKGLRNNPNT